MRPNWYLISSAIFCFFMWWLITTTFVSCMGPYMGSYQ